MCRPTPPRRLSGDSAAFNVRCKGATANTVPQLETDVKPYLSKISSWPFAGKQKYAMCRRSLFFYISFHPPAPGTRGWGASKTPKPSFAVFQSALSDAFPATGVDAIVGSSVRLTRLVVVGD